MCACLAMRNKHHCHLTHVFMFIIFIGLLFSFLASDDDKSVSIVIDYCDPITALNKLFAVNPRSCIFARAPVRDTLSLSQTFSLLPTDIFFFFHFFFTCRFPPYRSLLAPHSTGKCNVNYESGFFCFYRRNIVLKTQWTEIVLPLWRLTVFFVVVFAWLYSWLHWIVFWDACQWMSQQTGY